MIRKGIYSKHIHLQKKKKNQYYNNYKIQKQWVFEYYYVLWWQASRYTNINLSAYFFPLYSVFHRPPRAVSLSAIYRTVPYSKILFLCIRSSTVLLRCKLFTNTSLFPTTGSFISNRTSFSNFRRILSTSEFRKTNLPTANNSTYLIVSRRPRRISTINVHTTDDSTLVHTSFSILFSTSITWRTAQRSCILKTH